MTTQAEGAGNIIDGTALAKSVHEYLSMRL